MVGGIAGRFIQEENFASQAERDKLLEAMLEVYSRSNGISVMVATPYKYPYVQGTTSVHPGYVVLSL